MQALQLARLLLQQPPPAEQAEAHAGLARLTIQAAYGAMAVSEQAVVAALNALSFVHTPGEGRTKATLHAAPALSCTC